MGREDPLTRATRDWLEIVQQDLRGADELDNAALPALAVYHWQQAAEKALKAYLTWQQQPFLKTHDLLALVHQCEAVDSSFGQLQPAAQMLTPFVSQFRYPAARSEPSRQETDDARLNALDVVGFVMSRLPSETHPAEA